MVYPKNNDLLVLLEPLMVTGNPVEIVVAKFKNHLCVYPHSTKMRFFIKDISEEILNGKFHFLCSASWKLLAQNQQ